MAKISTESPLDSKLAVLGPGFQVSSKDRIESLHHLSDAVKSSEYNLERSRRIVASLFSLYPRFTDKRSERAIVSFFDALLSQDQDGDLAGFVVELCHQDATRATRSPIVYLAILDILSVAVPKVLVSSGGWRKSSEDILETIAIALHACLESRRKGLKTKALRLTRSAFTTIFASRAGGSERAAAASTFYTASPKLSVKTRAPILGTLASVFRSLETQRPELVQALRNTLDTFFAFFSKEIAGSKSPLPNYITHSLAPFFSIISLSEFENSVAPVIERGLLRSPEVLLDDVVGPIVQALSTEIDITDSFLDRLFKPLLNSTKSTNPAVRKGAINSFKITFKRCQSQKIFKSLSTEVLAPLKQSKVSSVDQKISFAELLSLFSPSLDSLPQFISDLSIIASKEANEVVLRADLENLSTHVIDCFNSGVPLPEDCINAFAKGCKDKKPTVSKRWAFCVGSVLQAVLKSDEVISEPVHSFIECFFTATAPIWKDTVANPVAAAQNGTIPVSYVIGTILLNINKGKDAEKLHKALGTTNVIAQLFPTSTKSSMLFDSRVFLKLTLEEDILWFLGAVEASISELMSNPEVVQYQPLWSDALFYQTCSLSSTQTIRKKTLSVTEKARESFPKEAGLVCIETLWSWLLHISAGTKESLATMAKTSTTHLSLIIDSIISSEIPSDVLSDLLIRLVVICQPSLVQSCSWIQLCLRAKADPGQLATNFTDKMMTEIISATENRELAGDGPTQLRRAQATAAADLLFVAPTASLLLWLAQTKADLRTEGQIEIGETEVAILNTPEGEAYVNVLELTQKADGAAKRTPKDTKPGKKSDMPKLTADDRAKIAAQIEKESEIRKEIKSVVSKMLRGLFFVQALLDNPASEFGDWLIEIFTSVRSVISYDKHNILDYYPARVYLNLSVCTSERLDTIRRPIGLATLRSEGASLPEDCPTDEDLGELVTRVLYHLRISSEMYPMDTLSFAYCFGLLLRVLNDGGIAVTKPDSREEQTLLVIEIFNFHLQQASDPRLLRSQLLSTLLFSLHKYPVHAKPIKECILGYVRAISGDISNEETQILLDAVISEDTLTRTVALQAIDDDLDLGSEDYRPEIWIARHDSESEHREIATDIMEESGFQVPVEAIQDLVGRLGSPDLQLRQTVARTLASTIEKHKSSFGSLLQGLKAKYIECIPEIPQTGPGRAPVRRGNAIIDKWEARHGVALTFKELDSAFENDEVVEFVRFLLEAGCFQDSNLAVRDEMVSAGAAIVSSHGRPHLNALFAMLEKPMEGESKSDVEDTLREAAVILYGTLAKHLNSGDSRSPKVVARLLDTLGTPSETVQEAVANCLPALVRSQPADVSDYVDRLEEDLLRGKKYAIQRGAAYGIAGVVKGRGIAALREFRIMEMLSNAAANRKDIRERQGAFLCYELLSSSLGLLYEPYLIESVPQLLAGFGDSSADVRSACLDASKAAFSKLSSYGVRTILPTILSGLDDDQWRTKKGACELLGAMAFLDPRQLAIRLPEIIPSLTEVLADSHKEVQNAANRSLARFGEVLQNPEIKSVVNDLMAALSDPTKNTEKALDKLIRVQFVHYLDAPSLAVVVRVVERGLSDKSSTKQKSAQIIASLAHLADKSDLVDHLPILVSGLRASTVDPVPATRATSSKALGTLVEKLGEDAVPDLIPSLMEALRSDISAGDRIGSAQALSEVLAGLGTSRLEETLPSVLQGARSQNPTVREGFMSLFIYLPACFGNSFSAYLGKLIPPILAGLADDVEGIRETALRAARLLVKNFAAKAVDLFLPELERGLGDDSFRIRLSSAELVGDLLFNLMGISKDRAEGEEEGEEDDMPLNERSQTLLSVLGAERRNRILASLYVCRSDTSTLVRTTTVNIWKAVVSSPRLLRDLVPAVSRLIIKRLSSPNDEQQTIAAAALGDLVRKAGDGVLTALLPTFETGFGSPDPDLRRGICLGLRELLNAVSAEDIEAYDEAIFDLIQTGLVDTDSKVRSCAAEAFDALQELVGRRAVEKVLPDLLSRLHTDDGPNALRGLLTLLTDSERANVIVPGVLSPLLQPPMTVFNARALASFSTAAPSALIRRLPSIINTLIEAILAEEDEEARDELRNSLDEISVSMSDGEALDACLNILIGLVKHDDSSWRSEGGLRLAQFFERVKADYSRFDSDLLHVLVSRLDDSNDNVVKGAFAALSAFTSSLTKVRMDRLINPAREALALVGTAGTVLPGFALPRGPSVLLPIFIHGLTTGSADQRTTSATALSDLITRADAASLKPFVIQITGALIRVVSDRSADVRAAVLQTLLDMLKTAPALLKSFLPQLQRAFAKALTDPASDLIRTRAADALGTLITLTPRVDPLVVELTTGTKAASEMSVRATIFKALREVVKVAGSTMSESSKAGVFSLVNGDFHVEGTRTPTTFIIREVALMAALVPLLGENEVEELFQTHVVNAETAYFGMLALNSLLIEAPASILAAHRFDTAVDLIISGIGTATNEELCTHSIIAAGKLLLSDKFTGDEDAAGRLLEALGKATDGANIAAIRRLAMVVIRAVGSSRNAIVAPHLGQLVPVVYDSVRDRNMQVKLTAETAFTAILDVVENDSAAFDSYVSREGDRLGPQLLRSMSEYFKRVATRLASQERERREAEGGTGALGLSVHGDDLAKVWQPVVVS